jgi:uncharacterized protein (TIGR02117 family)
MTKCKLLVVILLAACCACTGSVKELYPTAKDGPVFSIYLVSHSWHTGIVIKRADIPSGIWPESKDFSAAEYLEIGWGDWDFYQSREPGSWLTFKAAFWPTASVLHVVGFRGPLVRYFPYNEIIELELSQRDFKHLCRYLHNSYARDSPGVVRPLGPGLYGDSRFYPARGKFHLLNTCNVWAARALQAAGYPLTSAITTGGVMSQARKFGRVIQSRPTDR